MCMKNPNVAVPIMFSLDLFFFTTHDNLRFSHNYFFCM